MGLRDCADLYRFGVGPPRLVHYIGGTMSRAEHAERFSTEPLPIVAEFERALGGVRGVDLLVSPSPPTYLEYAIDVLLPQAVSSPK
jgi:hypothetical protein